MCEPTTIALATLALGTMSAVNQQEAAENQAEAVNKQYEQNRVNTIASLEDDYRQNSERQMQEQDASAEQLRQRKAQEREDLATARVGAGEAGITGLSVESIMRDISSLSAQDETNINQGKDWRVSQLATESSGLRNQAISRISGAPTATAPNKWAMGLNIASSAVGAANNYSSTTGKNLFTGKKV